MNFEQARFNMIEQQIRPWDVLDASVLELLSVVKREDFVPAEHRHLAFADVELPLPQGGSLLTPKVEARLLQEADAHKHEKALVVGHAGLYLAALLAHKVASVTLLMPDEASAGAARATLQACRVPQVQVSHGRADQGLASAAPFDLIVLAGSVPSVPTALVQQLKVEGRLAAIVGHAPVMQAQIVRRTAQGQQTRTVFETVAARLVGVAEPNRFSF
jgi:protein-L-isoaspartate(D-aspartate) O-methyltransferase